MLLTIKQTALELACSPKQVRKIIDSGELKVVRLGETARSDRVCREDLDEYIKDNRKTYRKCLSINVARSGTSMSRLEVNGLRDLLDWELRGKKRKNSKQISGPALQAVK